MTSMTSRRAVVSCEAKKKQHARAFQAYATTTVITDLERFAGLNVCSFNPIEFFVEILSCCLGQKCLLVSIIKERPLYLWKNLAVLMK